MPAVARSGTDSVFSPDGTGWKCQFPMTTNTGPPTQSRVSAMGTLLFYPAAFRLNRYGQLA